MKYAWEFFLDWAIGPKVAWPTLFLFTGAFCWDVVADSGEFERLFGVSNWLIGLAFAFAWWATWLGFQLAQRRDASTGRNSE
jgi:uncharacterized membrane protein